MYKIKELADMYGIRTNVLRFYEEKGLLKASRMENGYRFYTEADKKTLQHILLYRAMDFSITDIKRLLFEESEKKYELYFQQLAYLNQRLHELSAIRDHINEQLNAMLANTYEETKDQEAIQQLLHDWHCNREWKDRWQFDSFALVYDEVVHTPDADGLPFYQNYETVLDKTAEQAIQHGGKLLDIGCGTGNLLAKLKQQGYEEVGIGVDQSLTMLMQAKRKLPTTLFYQGTFLNLPFAQGSFDTITTSFAFHHCDEQERVLAIKEMKRVLRPQGRIIITDLLFEHPQDRKAYEETATSRQRLELADECFTDIEALTKLFTNQGFVCQAEEVSQHIWIFTADCLA